MRLKNRLNGMLPLNLTKSKMQFTTGSEIFRSKETVIELHAC